MKILSIPNTFQPPYKSTYPPYSSGENMEEIFYKYFMKNKESIKSDLIYIPIFWTSFYVKRKYGTQIKDLLDFLDKLDKSKKYFTVVQYATGIFVNKKNLDITVFSAGGGGINIKRLTERKVTMNGNPNRVIFIGDKAKYDLPLMCEPLMKTENVEKNILCSFMGRLDTHPCRFDMDRILKKNKGFVISPSRGYKAYKEMLGKSTFVLCPRGYGYTSFRLFEAMLMECIPIYIWEDKKVLPFSDEIKWNEFCILVKTPNINQITSIIENMSNEEKERRLNKIREYNKTYFNFAGSFEYIKRKIN